MKLIVHGRQLLRWLSHLPDRVSHPLRRKRLLRHLARRGWPRSVLFVCHGNICRSPYAAAAFARCRPGPAPGDIHVASAGFMGPNRPVPPEAARVAARRGLDLSPHRSQLISAYHTRQAELIVVMDSLQRRRVCLEFGRYRRDVVILGDLDPQSIDRRAIHDPISQPEESFEASYARIDRCVDSLVSALARASAQDPLAWAAVQRA